MSTTTSPLELDAVLACESCLGAFRVDIDHNGHPRPQRDRRYCSERCRMDARNARRRELAELRRRYAGTLAQLELEAVGALVPLPGMPVLELPAGLAPQVPA